ncbi:hypothetical protein PVT68_02945 [Microbulbifer bruguierae]|uniref:Uncharacterized protein n=1 Tax=Microbulbifer bruguierae TaxID=3029061 RepID=A0ABY8NEB9_9GAMM|nr:DUF6586 family protein [Microbulbifer bruguierae]WGL17265.1 hypothetical protein PVT68_02945 [Microbulbifer bruguierae]
MSNPYTGLVAAALRKCQLLLNRLEAEGSGDPLCQSALGEGALLQLWRGYRAFLAEQAHQLQLGVAPGREPESAGQLQQLVAQNGKFSAEIAELVSLAENPDSWYRQMDTAWRCLWHAPQAPSTRAQSAATGAAVQTLIPVRQVDVSSGSGSSQLDAQSLREWHRALSELVQRQRAQGQEW